VVVIEWFCFSFTLTVICGRTMSYLIPVCLWVCLYVSLYIYVASCVSLHIMESSCLSKKLGAPTAIILYAQHTTKWCCCVWFSTIGSWHFIRYKYHHSVLPPCEGIPLSTTRGRAWLPAWTSSLPMAEYFVTVPY